MKEISLVKVYSNECLKDFEAIINTINKEYNINIVILDREDDINRDYFSVMVNNQSIIDIAKKANKGYYNLNEYFDYLSERGLKDIELVVNGLYLIDQH